MNEDEAVKPDLCGARRVPERHREFFARVGNAEQGPRDRHSHAALRGGVERSSDSDWVRAVVGEQPGRDPRVEG